MLVFYVILAAVIVGGGVAFTALHKMHWTAFVAAAAVAFLLPLPVNTIGLSIAKNDQQTFHEYWNGYETNAYSTEKTCERDGSCSHTYDCDPYTVTEIEHYTDSEGKSQTRTVTKTKYHSCPYSTRETNYYVDSTLETFTVASRVMTGEQYRIGHPIPGGRVTEAPSLWTQALERIQSGKPGPVSTVNNYKNYILGSQQTLFKRYSGIIDQLREEKLLPDITKGIEGLYSAQKLHFVGELEEIDKNSLREQVSYLNGAVGTELRGDLHVVLIDSDELTVSAEDYSNALLAHWQNSEVFGRDALAKNSIVLVLSVEPYKAPQADEPVTEATPSPEATASAPVIDDEPTIKDGTPVVKWAKALTGMLIGNEALLQQLSSELPGTPVDDSLFGKPSYDTATEKVLHSEGIVEEILWGSNKFERVSMEAKDADDSGSGFGYLGDDWQPDSGTLTWIFLISGFLCALALAAGAYLSISMRMNRTSDFVRYLFTKH